MKKITAFLLAAVLLLCAAGCGEKKSPEILPETSAHIGLPQETTQPQSEPQLVPEIPPETAKPEPVLSSQPEPREEDFVRVTDYIPDIVVELKYASSDNFVGSKIYEFDQAYLRYGTVKKLIAVQKRLAEYGLGLKIWDGFRPVSAQFALWEACPDPKYVANPEIGFSSHSRGNTVDLTLVNDAGMELTMPTGFDDFSPLADRDYSDCPEEAASNALLLQQVMEEAGFTGYFGEWWHFSDTVQYDVEKVFTPVSLSQRYALCNEFITLRRNPDVTAEELLKIPAGDSFAVMAVCGEFYYVNHRGVCGYVLASYTAPLEA